MKSNSVVLVLFYLLLFSSFPNKLMSQDIFDLIASNDHRLIVSNDQYELDFTLKDKILLAPKLMESSYQTEESSALDIGCKQLSNEKNDSTKEHSYMLFLRDYRNQLESPIGSSYSYSKERELLHPAWYVLAGIAGGVIGYLGVEPDQESLWLFIGMGAVGGAGLLFLLDSSTR